LLLVGGVPGIGKTYAIRQVCREVDRDPTIVSPANPHALAEELHEHSNDDLIVLDDYSSLLTSAEVYGDDQDRFCW
jgi:MoxR-like ATPase